MSVNQVVLCNPVRTPIGTYNGSLKNIPATTLGSTVIREVLKRSGLATEKIESVVMGQVIQAGCKMNPARQAMLEGGLPVNVPAMTVNRVCGSGAQCLQSPILESLIMSKLIRERYQPKGNDGFAYGSFHSPA